MTLITTNDQLRRHIPNTFAPVPGETPLYDKIAPQIRAAEQWFEAHITPLADLYDDSGENLTQRYAIPEDIVPGIIVAHAFRNSIDSLNVVLTANGFGIVSNDQTAPASKERTDSLKRQLEIQRDAGISNLLTCIDAFDWTACHGWDKFHETLINFNSHIINPVRFDDWEREQGVFRIVEDNLARKYISAALYDRLREKYVHTEPHYARLRMALQVAERNILNGVNQHGQLRGMVDVIRTATLADGTPDPCFDCWRESPAARLWQDHSFKNDPKKGGIWI